MESEQKLTHAILTSVISNDLQALVIFSDLAKCPTTQDRASQPVCDS